MPNSQTNTNSKLNIPHYDVGDKIRLSTSKVVSTKYDLWLCVKCAYILTLQLEMIDSWCAEREMIDSWCAERER